MEEELSQQAPDPQRFRETLRQFRADGWVLHSCLELCCTLCCAVAGPTSANRGSQMTDSARPCPLQSTPSRRGGRPAQLPAQEP